MAGQPIFTGYEWRQSIQFDSAEVPSGSTFRAEMRASAGSAVLATLTTANGGIERVSDYEMTIVVTAAQSSAISSPHVYMDVVRTDGEAESHLGFQLRVEVETPITEPAA